MGKIMCDHDHLVESRGEIVCTLCGLVLRDEDVPSAWFRTEQVDRVVVSKTMQRQIELMSHAMRLPDCVASSTGELATQCGFRSSNLNALAACMYITAKRHRLDRLEREFLLALPGIQNRLFLKYIKQLKSQEAQMAVSGLETLRRIVPRVACDMTTDHQKRSDFARRLDAMLLDVYPVYADTLTPVGIFRVALDRVRGSR